MTSRYPIVSIWHAHAAPGAPGAIDVAHPEDALVVRPDSQVLVIPLPPGGAMFLRALADHGCLVAAATAVAGRVPDFDLVACVVAACRALAAPVEPAHGAAEGVLAAVFRGVSR